MTLGLASNEVGYNEQQTKRNIFLPPVLLIDTSVQIFSYNKHRKTSKLLWITTLAARQCTCKHTCNHTQVIYRVLKRVRFLPADRNREWWRMLRCIQTLQHWSSTNYVPLQRSVVACITRVDNQAIGKFYQVARWTRAQGAKFLSLCHLMVYSHWPESGPWQGPVVWNCVDTHIKPELGQRPISIGPTCSGPCSCPCSSLGPRYAQCEYTKKSCSHVMSFCQRYLWSF